MSRLLHLSSLLAMSLTSIAAQPQIANTGTPAEQIRRVENGLAPMVLIQGETARSNILERMRATGTPAVSIAVIENFRISWAKAYGVKEESRSDAVDTDTLFQAASISKSFTATAIMRLVQEGRLRLEQPVNTCLSNWKLPENDLTRQSPVTLAHLLSHTAGINVPSFPGYPAGTAIPTPLQILNGNSPANTPGVTVERRPGTGFRYSGGGTLVLGQVLCDTRRQSFPALMQELILAPLGMTRSYFEQPLMPNHRSDAAVAHGNGKPCPGGAYSYPELSAAGLWTTPTDLARFAIAHQLAALGRNDRFLTRALEQQMITPRGSDEYGLGFSLDPIFKGKYFGHSGGNRGFASLLLAHKEKGYGVAVMVNSEGMDLIREIVVAVADAYGWEALAPVTLEPVAFTTEAQERVCGRYLFAPDNIATIEMARGQLQVSAPGLALTSRLIPLANGEFHILKTGRRLLYKQGSTPAQDRLALGPEQFVKLAPDHLEPCELLATGRIELALQQYRTWHTENPGNSAISENRLNQLGYALLNSTQYQAAVALFSLITELYPTSANAWDSLGEGALKTGDKVRARTAFTRALGLNPKLENSRRLLLQLDPKSGSQP
jgi:CubicO group peptidase (beta-lactamase class C family)